MADTSSEKTEKPTARKRSKAREEGQVLRSVEVNTVVCSVAMFSLFIMILPDYISKLMESFRVYLGPGSLIYSGRELTPNEFSLIVQDAAVRMAMILLPLFATAMVTGIAVNLFQFGFLFTTKPLSPKLSKISPIAGFKRMFTLRSLAELLKSILKITVLGWLVYSDYKALLGKLPYMMGVNLYDALLETMRIALRIALKCTLALAVIALFDFLFQWKKHEKELMMTKQEVKDENKQVEGNPETKSRIRTKMRQMSAMRMLSNVQNADVVITNPTHYAVALRFKEGEDNAPVVIAKGLDFVAQRIKEAAREHGVKIVEDKPLAQALYAACEVGDEIPEEFYYAVADILKYIYEQRMRRGGSKR